MEWDDRLFDAAVDMVIAMMASASTDNIRPIDWWTRARSALEAAASSSDTWPQMVSRMGRKLQIDALSKSSSLVLAGIGEAVSDEFAEFREIAERDALYVVAMAQTKRSLQKEARRAEI